MKAEKAKKTKKGYRIVYIPDGKIIDYVFKTKKAAQDTLTTIEKHHTPNLEVASELTTIYLLGTSYFLHPFNKDLFYVL